MSKASVALVLVTCNVTTKGFVSQKNVPDLWSLKILYH